MATVYNSERGCSLSKCESISLVLKHKVSFDFAQAPRYRARDSQKGSTLLSLAGVYKLRQLALVLLKGGAERTRRLVNLRDGSLNLLTLILFRIEKQPQNFISLYVFLDGTNRDFDDFFIFVFASSDCRSVAVGLERSATLSAMPRICIAGVHRA